MPEVPVKEVRLPELRLPEIKRDEIVRSLSEIRLPDVELPKIDMSTLERSAAELQKIDLGKAVAGAVAAARIVSPAARRPRWPVAIGVFVALGLIAWALFRSPAVRDRADRATRTARERIDEMRRERQMASITPDDIATTVAEEAWTDDVAAGVPVMDADPAETVGAGNGIRAFEESNASA